MSSAFDRWGGPAWAFQSKADAFYDISDGSSLSSGNLDLAGTLDVTGAVTLDSTAEITGTLTQTGVATFAAEPIVAIDSATTAAVVDGLTVRVTSTGTPAAGLGTAIVFESENDAPATHEAGRIEVDWATVTAASEDSDMRFDVYDGGTKVTPLAIIGATPQVTVTGQLGVTSIATFNAEPVVAIDSAVTAAVVDAMTLRVTSTGTPAAGLGAGLVFDLENDAPATHEAARIEVDWETETAASEDSDMRFQVYDGGSLVTPLAIVGSTPEVNVTGNLGVTAGVDLNEGSRQFQLNATTVTVTSSELKALAGTNKTLVAAPGAGFSHLLQFAIFSYDAGAVGYTVQADEDLRILYGVGGNNASVVCLGDNNTGGIDFTGTTDKVARIPSTFPADTAATDQGWEDNKALVLDNVGAGEWDDGDGELDITCFYYTIANPSA
jgi:hypothetical protein